MTTANSNGTSYIFLKKIVTNTSSNSEGDKLYFALIQAKRQGHSAVLVADNDHSFASSFLNSSVGRFIDEFGLKDFKCHFKFKGTKSQFDRINNYLTTCEEIFS